jgi:hypothetical protein
MKTAKGTKLVLSPATSYILRNILTEWVNEYSPVHEYVERRYRGYDENFRKFKEEVLTERVTGIKAVIEQLED